MELENKGILKPIFTTAENLTEEKIEQIIERWAQFGFTVELEGNKLKNNSLAMEIAAQYLLSKSERKYILIEEITFPIIRRVLNKVEDEIKVDVLKENVIELIEKLASVDHEAEYCAKFSDEYQLNL